MGQGRVQKTDCDDVVRTQSSCHAVALTMSVINFVCTVIVNLLAQLHKVHVEVPRVPTWKCGTCHRLPGTLYTECVVCNTDSTLGLRLAGRASSEWGWSPDGCHNLYLWWHAAWYTLLLYQYIGAFAVAARGIVPPPIRQHVYK